MFGWLKENPEVSIALIGIIVPLVTLLFNRLDVWHANHRSKKTGKNIYQNAMKILLRHVMEQHVNRWVAQGFITRNDLEKFDNMYEVYDSLIGMNGYAEQLYTDIHNLPVK